MNEVIATKSSGTGAVFNKSGRFLELGKYIVRRSEPSIQTNIAIVAHNPPHVEPIN